MNGHFDTELLEWFEQRVVKPVARIEDKVDEGNRRLNSHLDDHVAEVEKAEAARVKAQQDRDKLKRWIEVAGGVIAAGATAYAVLVQVVR